MLGLITITLTWGLTENMFITFYAGLMVFAFSYAQRMYLRQRQLETAQAHENQRRY